ncbi:MAG TPA: GAF and ANTAR domain-containing protein [Nocardioides sp.]|jgi:GAF domain-containing protein|nr:GAF and ANTAR domain-containing protein [Nocardioides sp.]
MAEQDPSDVDGSELSESLTALGQFVLSEQSLQESLQRVAELCVRAVYGADGAGVTWVVARKPTTVTAAGDFVRRIDEIQYALGEGPCLQAYATQRMVLVEDLEREDRWPRFTPAALDNGLRGLVAAPLSVHGTQMGALNIYALQSGVFDDTAVRTAELFAEQAAIVLANAEAFTRAQTTANKLGEALTSRAVIDMAKGIIMSQEKCTPLEAFDHLRRLSQTRHRKVREIAQELVDEMSQGGQRDPADGADT